MVDNDRIFGVLLNDEGWKELQEPLKPYTSEGAIGKYLYCKSVHPNGNYFSMEVTATNPDNSTFDAEISIPHRYVKFVIAAQDKRTIGFLSD